MIRVRRYFESIGYDDVDGVSDHDLVFELSKLIGIRWKSNHKRNWNPARRYLRWLVKAGRFPTIRDEFYRSPAWRHLRVKVFKVYGTACMKCGSNDDPTVDHIMPRSRFPNLELSFDNLQVLCRSCNSSKSNTEIVDYRTPKASDGTTAYRERTAAG